MKEQKDRLVTKNVFSCLLLSHLFLWIKVNQILRHYLLRSIIFHVIYQWMNNLEEEMH